MGGKMLLYEITRQYKTLSVIGMCKNAGKTTAMNALIRENGKHGGTLGLTSIGRDGESVDVVTKTHKPGIYAQGNGHSNRVCDASARRHNQSDT